MWGSLCHWAYPSFSKHTSLTRVALQKKFPLTSQFTWSLLKLVHEVRFRHHHFASHHDNRVISTTEVRIQVILRRCCMIAQLLWLVSQLRLLLHPTSLKLLLTWVTDSLVEGSPCRLVDHDALEIASVDLWRAFRVICHGVFWLAKNLVMREIGQKVGLLGP